MKIQLVLFAALATFVVGCSPDENKLVNAAVRDDLVTFKKIAAKGISLDTQEIGMLGRTPLVVAASYDGTNVFFYLLSAGAKVDGRDRDGETPLMHAVQLGDGNSLKIKALIAAGADVNAHSKGRASVLKYADWADMSHNRSMTNTYNLLEEHGAKY